MKLNPVPSKGHAFFRIALSLALSSLGTVSAYAAEGVPVGPPPMEGDQKRAQEKRGVSEAVQDIGIPKDVANIIQGYMQGPEEVMEEARFC